MQIYKTKKRQNDRTLAAVFRTASHHNRISDGLKPPKGRLSGAISPWRAGHWLCAKFTKYKDRS